MENKDNKDGSKGCVCMTCHDHGNMHGGTCCCCSRGGRFSILRIVLGVILLIFVFWFGVKVGEVKALFGGGYAGRYMMMHSQYGNMGGAQVPLGGTATPAPSNTY